MKIELIFHQVFFYIALDNYREIEKLVREWDEIQSVKISQANLDQVRWSLQEKYNRIFDLTLIVVIFCTLSLEAYMNNYGIRRLSKNHFQNYLDKLELFSKWMVIPRITTGIQLDAGSKIFQDLDWLITIRNRLTHYKSKVIEGAEIRQIHFLREDDARRAIETVRNMVVELSKIDNTVDTAWITNLDYR